MDFKELAEAVGYAPETIEYGDNNIIVSFERYDKKIQEYEAQLNFVNSLVIIKKHLGLDIKEYYDEVYNYLASLDDVDPKVMKTAKYIYTLLDNLMEEYAKEKDN